MKFSPKSKFVVVFAAIWALAVGGGLRMMMAYDNTPGASAAAPSVWPTESRIPRDARVATLVMMIHPQCPCSRASIGELALLMAELPQPVNAHVLFIRPRGFPEKWEQTDLWNSAAMIPRVEVAVDNEGDEAGRFGSQTSGQVMLYDKNGRLIFNGGITASRGESGNNDGRRAIVSLLTQPRQDIAKRPVFGCPLFERSSNPHSENSCNAFHKR